MALPTHEKYQALHYYWDEMDREYTISAIWLYERSYPEMPDSEILESIEIEEQERNAPDINISKGSDVWRSVESDGIPFDAIEYTEDYY